MTEDERRSIEQDCARLIALYATLSDASRWEDVAGLFAADGRMARPSAPDEWITGRDAILKAFRSRPARLARHLYANVVIDVRSGTEAAGESTMALFLPDGLFKLGTYRDVFVRIAADWKFAERRGSIVF